MNTIELLERWHDGDDGALDQLVARHAQWIHAQVQKRLGNVLGGRADAYDIAQDAIIEVLRYGPQFVADDEHHYRAMLLRIVENTICKHVRDAHRGRRDVRREQPIAGSQSVLQLSAGGTRPSAAADREEQRAWIRLAMELLRADDREVIQMRQWDGLDFATIGERLGQSADAARMRFQRALGRLARVLERLRQGRIDDALAE